MVMERRHALLPVCSGSLGLCCAALQLIAVATPHWASFWTKDPFGNGITRPEEDAFEAGYYGLWSLCLTTQNWEALQEVKCDLRETVYDPGKFRYIAGAFAITNLLLLLVFLCPIPAQLFFLAKDKGVVPVSFRCLTTIKIISISFGGASAIAAAAIVNFDKKNPTYQEQKQWSFGMQIVVIVLSAFLLICSSAEHMVGGQYPRGPLSKIRQSRALAAISNAGFSDNKSPETRPMYVPPPASLYEREVAPIKRSNLNKMTHHHHNNNNNTTRSLTSPSLTTTNTTTSEPLSVKTLEARSLDRLDPSSQERDKKQARRDKRRKKGKLSSSQQETSSMMEYSNPEFKYSVESGLDDLESIQFKSKDEKQEEQQQQQQLKPSYFFGTSLESSNNQEATCPSPVSSVGKLSHFTNRSTDV